MTLRMYAGRKGWPLHGVEVHLEHGRIHAKDCEDCETEKGLLDEIHSEIRLSGDLDPAQRQRLLEIAERCPVHRTMTSEVKIRTSELR
ncbi:MAG: OsmC family protein [Planctomycetota bacterium]